MADAKDQEFERRLKVAWSCLKDVEKKVNEIREAKDARDRASKEGPFRGAIAMAALQGRLQREFDESLDLAWNSATQASDIRADGFVEVDDLEINPRVVFAGVCGLRGDLKFALERWDEAARFYSDALRYGPDNPVYHYNLAATYTNKHDPAAAIQQFEKVIGLDPTGDFGIEATKNLDKLKAGKLGQKSFSGSWKVVVVLGGLTLMSLFLLGKDLSAGMVNLFFWGGILALYWWRKFK
jgi:tetratricopeptide (TPR) repeat protein